VGTIWDGRSRRDRRWIWRLVSVWLAALTVGIAAAWLILKGVAPEVFEPSGSRQVVVAPPASGRALSLPDRGEERSGRTTAPTDAGTRPP